VITRKLAIFVGSSNVANRMADCVEFRELLATLDPRCPVPARTAIGKELSRVFKELKAKIAAHPESANKVLL